MRKAPVWLLATAVAILVPALAAGKSEEFKWSPYEAHYLGVYEQCFKAFGSDCGANLLQSAWTDEDPVPRATVEESAARMERWLDPPAPEPAAAPASNEYIAPDPAPTSSVPTTSAGGCDAACVACESGGDPTAVNPNGHYGKYQFDQGTWDTYAPEGYAGIRPDQAPESVQDQAASAVTYDAWEC